MKKKILVFLMMMLMGIITGCGMSEDDAKEYVKASLDAAYKGEFEAFVNITDSTPEGAKAMYEENIIHTMEAAGFNEKNLDEELLEKYEQFFLKSMNMADYTIGEAYETPEGDFEVEVVVRPLKVFEGIDQTVTDEVLSRIEKMKKHPTEKQITKISFEVMYDILAKKIDKAEYGDEKAVVIRLHKNEEGMYMISEEDMIALDSTLFAVD